MTMGMVMLLQLLLLLLLLLLHGHLLALLHDELLLLLLLGRLQLRLCLLVLLLLLCRRLLVLLLHELLMLWRRRVILCLCLCLCLRVLRLLLRQSLLLLHVHEIEIEIGQRGDGRVHGRHGVGQMRRRWNVQGEWWTLSGRRGSGVRGRLGLVRHDQADGRTEAEAEAGREEKRGSGGGWAPRFADRSVSVALECASATATEVRQVRQWL